MPLSLRILLFPTLLVLFGCSSRFADLCEQAANCEGGGDDDIDACIASAEGEEEIASIRGCEREFDAYYDCVENNATCLRDDGTGRGSLWETFSSSTFEDLCREPGAGLDRCSYEVAP